MRRGRLISLAASVLLAAAVTSAAGQTQGFASRWRTGDIIVDGSADEWKAPESIEIVNRLEVMGPEKDDRRSLVLDMAPGIAVTIGQPEGCSCTSCRSRSSAQRTIRTPTVRSPARRSGSGWPRRVHTPHLAAHAPACTHRTLTSVERRKVPQPGSLRLAPNGVCYRPSRNPTSPLTRTWSSQPTRASIPMVTRLPAATRTPPPAVNAPSLDE